MSVGVKQEGKIGMNEKEYIAKEDIEYIFNYLLKGHQDNKLVINILEKLKECFDELPVKKVKE